MKKYNVFKVLLIALFAAIICSFLIPQSQLSYTGIEKGVITPITFVDSVSNMLTSFSVFIATFVYILCIGIFYTILKKTEKYDVIINNIAAKFKNKKVFLIISVLVFGLLTAFTGELYATLFLVPAFIDVIKKLGYDSKTAILSTAGAIIIGSANSFYTNYANQILATTVKTNVVLKVILLVGSLVALIIFTIFTSKSEDVKLKKEQTKKTLPIYIIAILMIVLLILGMVPWGTYFGFKGFSNFHAAIVDFKLFKVSIFNALVGSTLTAFGEWTIYSLLVMLLFFSIVIAIIYKIKINDIMESFAKGIRKALPYGFIMILASVILVGVYNSGFFVTVINSIGKMKDSLLASTTLSGLSSLVYPDYTYASQFTLSTIAAVISKKAIFATLAIVFQLIYSLVLLISPTSIIMLMALRYEDVRYKDWVKYIYKFFLALLIVYLIVIMIIGGKFVKTISYVVLAVLVVILALFIILDKTRKPKVKEPKKTKKK